MYYNHYRDTRTHAESRLSRLLPVHSFRCWQHRGQGGVNCVTIGIESRRYPLLEFECSLVWYICINEKLLLMRAMTMNSAMCLHGHWFILAHFLRRGHNAPCYDKTQASYTKKQTNNQFGDSNTHSYLVVTACVRLLVVLAIWNALMYIYLSYYFVT